MTTRGFSQAGLRRTHDVMAGYIERGEMPGIVTLVSRRGEVHVDAIGMKALGGSDTIRCDTIFRIASMAKPLTAAVAMMLSRNVNCGSTSRWTDCCPSSPIVRFGSGSTARSTRRCPQIGRSPCATC